MTSSVEEGRATSLSPEEAFKALGNETRIQILQVLGEADGPLSFTELRTRLNYRHGGQFNYHLDKLVGHFVSKTDDGYRLREPGRRVIEAVLSGAVTETPVIERTETDHRCQLCDAPIQVEYSQERLETYCTECSGIWATDDEETQGYLGAFWLPPAGVQDRTPSEVVNVAWTWTQVEILLLASDICPRCSAPLATEEWICEDHDTASGLCAECGNRYAVSLKARCTNCFFERSGTFSVSLAAATELLDFVTTHGLNPIAPDVPSEIQRIYSCYDEELLSRDPFRAKYSFSTNDESLTLTVDENLRVVDANKR